MLDQVELVKGAEEDARRKSTKWARAAAEAAEERARATADRAGLSAERALVEATGNHRMAPPQRLVLILSAVWGSAATWLRQANRSTLL